jgi:hypothetical protein
MIKDHVQKTRVPQQDRKNLSRSIEEDPIKPLQFGAEAL